MRRTIRRWFSGIVLLLVALLGPSPSRAQDSAAALDEPGRAELRRASATWAFRAREGPRRRVVDQVCLVPDQATFLEAIAAWDAEHSFPILLEDAEYTFKFLRAFRPARVVRFPGPGRPVEPGRTWEAAVAAVGRSWERPGRDEGQAGDRAPRDLAATAPGVVVSAPGSPSLAGAVALAAGRFQPLIRWEPARHAAEAVPAEEAETLAAELEAKVAACVPDHGRLGDACDFLTLAGDYPYRYEAKVPQPGACAFDDLVGRDLTGRAGPRKDRWAFAGRLLGDPTQAVYRAMCSLFLQPDSARLFNGYNEADRPWSSYTMRAAFERLGRLLPTDHWAGPRQGSLAGWHQAFDPENRAGLVLINTSGHPFAFNLQGGAGTTADVPMTVPAAVLIIHSFSAADPADPQTVGGRWLANGAFLYYGSMNEPYLNAFRTPAVVADLIAEGLPFAAALRMNPGEAGPFGDPWRLVYLGDPLYRLDPAAAHAPRLATWEPVASWPSYGAAPTPAPAAEADDFAKLTWALKAAILAGRKGADRAELSAVADLLLTIRRDRLAVNHRALFDPLLADVLFHADRRRALRDRIGRLPASELTPTLRRWLEAARMVDLHRGMAKLDWSAALAAWDELIRSDSSAETKALATQFVAALADAPARRNTWRTRLRAALRDGRRAPGADAVEAELKRVEAIRP